MGNRFEIELEEFKKLREQNVDILIIDVREPWEWEICCFPEAKRIPLKELPNRTSELDQKKEIIVYCRSGGRSAKAVEFLKQAGFTKVKNLKGGIIGWASRFDPSMPTY
jgi:rhodanese-related sulfurtransferase